MKLAFHTAAALALVLSTAAAAQTASRAITAALADPARPAAERARDAARKPDAILAFAGVKPGDKVVDFIMGGGYFSRILAKTVGNKGRVYALQPAEFVAFRAAYGTEQDTVAAAYKNVTPLRPSLGQLAFPESVDLIFTAQNYHDLHLSVSPKGAADLVNAKLFAALKPGGTLLVIDHAAEAGSGTRDANSLHRIDPAYTRAEIEKAGFVFDGESPLLKDANDPHTKLVFDPAIRGKTDQFVYRFRKPKA